MRLLHFAHKAEAAHFLKNIATKSVEDIAKGQCLYGENEIILITGEGAASTTIKLSAVLTHFHGQIRSVINLGAAGALAKNLNYGDIVSLRTVLHQEQMKTFQSADLQSEIDGLSLLGPVNDPIEKEKLSVRAHVADLEAYDCAQVCDFFKIPFFSFKVITDTRDETTERLKVRKNFAPLGEKLFAYYRKFKGFD